MILKHRATIEDLYNEEGPAELVDGKIIRQMTGDRPGEVAGNICASLRAHVKQTGAGKARGDGVGYTVPLLPSGRESFCPDVSYDSRPPHGNRMRFVEGAPDFAVKVRSENDYGPAEARLADKRADYFAAGTKVVWYVDPVKRVVYCYRASDAQVAVLLRPGEVASAEPAVPGWRMPVDEIFAE